jgi:hypothetical protein
MIIPPIYRLPEDLPLDPDFELPDLDEPLRDEPLLPEEREEPELLLLLGVYELDLLLDGGV